MTTQELKDKLLNYIHNRVIELDKDKFINLDAKVCRQRELRYIERFIELLTL
jgi:hypothetical protein